MTHPSTHTRPSWTIELPRPRRQRGVNAAANVYPSCAAEGLAACFHDCDGAGLWLRLALRDGQRALFARPTGHPGTSGQADRP